MFPDITAATEICIDTETTGIEWYKHRVFGIAVAVEGQSWYWDVRRDPGVLPWLRDTLRDTKATVVNHSLKFDAHHLLNLGVNILGGDIACTMVAAALIDEHSPSFSLDFHAKKYVGVSKVDDIYEKLAQMFGGPATRKAQIGNLHKAPVELAAPYARRDVEAALALWQVQKKLIQQQELDRVWKVEMDLLKVLTKMERKGVRVDIEATHRASKELTNRADRMQRELNSMAGFEVNPNPSKSIETLFKPKLVDGKWILCDGTQADTTEGGKASINAEVLRRMSHPAAKTILSLRQILKTRDTFLQKHILGHELNGRVHANFNQTKSDNELGTGTGRLSVNDPALQQIHKRNKDIASVVRALFLPDEGDDWACIDWAQMDFRVASHYIKNKKILKMYRDNPEVDFHQLTADLTGLPRSPTVGIKGNAKQINLGLCFAMGEGKLAKEMGLPYTTESDGSGREWLRAGDEAKDIFKRYHEAVPGVRDFLDRAASVAKSRGFVRTVLGRRIRFPDRNFAYKAGGLIFQGSAADALKMKLVEVDRYLEGSEASLLLNVHDEFDITIPHGSRDKYGVSIQNIVQQFDGVFDVPIRSDLGVGPNWWEASK